MLETVATHSIIVVTYFSDFPTLSPVTAPILIQKLEAWVQFKKLSKQGCGGGDRNSSNFITNTSHGRHY